jgi:hypothetical protein
MLVNAGGVTIIDNALVTKKEKYREAILTKYRVRLAE